MTKQLIVTRQFYVIKCCILIKSYLVLKIYIDENCLKCVEATEERNYLEMKAKEVHIFKEVIRSDGS